MSENNSGITAGGCLKFGCFGCLALFVLLVGIMLLFGATQMSERTPQPEEVRTAHQLPPSPMPAEQTSAEQMPTYAEGEEPTSPEEAPRSLEMPSENENAINLSGDVAGDGRLILDIQMTHLTIRPGPSNEPLRIEADYDAKSFELTEELTEAADGSWDYNVTFTGSSSWLDEIFGNGASDNRIEIIVPRGYPLEIVGSVAQGKSEIDLGGLWVRNVDLDVAMGNHLVEFRDPLPEPMERFRVQGAMGDVEVHDLGAASPAQVRLGHDMGNFNVDLGGDWVRDGEIEVEFNMGNCRVIAPENAHLKIDRINVDMGGKNVSYDDLELAEGAPVVTLRASGAMGNLNVVD